MVILLMIERGKRSASNVFAFALGESVEAHVVQKVRQTAAKVRLCRSMRIVMTSRQKKTGARYQRWR
jgi:hypothetical protein